MVDTFESDPIHDAESAAAWIRENYKTRTSRGYLAKMRHEGIGPEFFLFGRSPRYRQSALRVWAEAKTSRPFTRTAEYVRTAA